MISIQNMTTLLPHESLDFLISRGMRFPDLFFLNQPNPHPKYPLPTRWAPQNQWNTWGWNGAITPVNRPKKWVSGGEIPLLGVVTLFIIFIAGSGARTCLMHCWEVLPSISTMNVKGWTRGKFPRSFSRDDRFLSLNKREVEVDSLRQRPFQMQPQQKTVIGFHRSSLQRVNLLQELKKVTLEKRDVTSWSDK